MAEQNLNTGSSGDEIDLSVFFKKIGDVIINIIFAFYKRIILISILLGLSIILGIVNYIRTPNIYNSELIISSRYLNKQISTSIINSLRRMTKERNYDELSSRLKLSTSTVKKIKEIRVSPFEKDTTKLPFIFKIEASVNDTRILDTLQYGLISYLSSINYVKKAREMDKKNLTDLIEKIKKEIESLESLKKIASTSLSPQTNKGGFVYGQPYDPLNIYRESAKLYQELTTAENSLELIQSFDIIQDFIKVKRPSSPNLIKNIFYNAIASMIVSIIIIILLELQIVLKRKQKEIKEKK